MSETPPTLPENDVLSLGRAAEALQSAPRFRGPDEPPDGHDCNDHFAQIYKTTAAKFAAAVPFVAHGLERGERCLYVVDEGTEAEARSVMRDGGIDVDEAVESGTLTIRTAQETYLENGTFDPDAMVEFCEELVADVGDDHPALRIVAEMDWLQDEPAVEQCMAYESKINRLYDDEDCTALCQYDRNAFPPEVVRDVVRTHPHLVAGDTACHNVYYTPPDEFFGPDDPAREVERMLDSLRDRTEAKTTLTEREQFLREMYDVTSDSDLSFTEKTEQLLGIGRDRFDVELGILARFSGDEFEVVETAGAHDTVTPGRTVPLSETYCRHLFETGDPLAVDEAGAEGLIDDPADETDGFESYLGDVVTVDAEVYGALCFVDSEARDRDFTSTEETFVELMSQWIGYELEREHRESQLAALNEMSRDLTQAETFSAIADETVRHAESTLRLPLTAVVEYDSGRGTLTPASQTSQAHDELPTSALCAREGACWDAFVAGETTVVDDVETVPEIGEDVSAVVAVPLEKRGLFLAGTRSEAGFRRAELEFVEATAATVSDACVRAEQARRLQRRKETLEDRTETLERLDHVNDIIRSIDRALVQASSRDEIEAVVCEQLSKSGPYELAWIGEEDPVEQLVVPHEWDGPGKGYVDGITVKTDESPRAQGPAGRAVTTGEPQIVDDVLTDEGFEPWRQSAVNRGYHSVAAFPLAYEDSLYGVLVVYASQPNVFDDLERAVLSELADNVAHAVNAVESKRALVNDEVTELEFTVDEPVFTVMELAEETGCEYSYEHHVARSGEQMQLFFTTRGVSASAVLDFSQRLYITDVELVSERTKDGQQVCHFKGQLTDDSFPATVLEHGGQLAEFHVADGSATITVHLSPDASIREFVTMITEQYPETSLTAQRTRSQTSNTFDGFRTALTEELTERQLEVLQTAYFSGYFEQPRAMTASEIADTLDISQPTLTSHLRVALRKLGQHLFEGQSLQF